MRYRTKGAIAIKGDRIEKGVEVELSESDFAQYDRNDFEPVEGVAKEPAPEPEPAVEEMNLEQLRAKAEALGLSKSGSKADLVERITLHLQGKVEDEMEPHIVTEEDLEANPALEESGVKVGDQIMLSKKEQEIAS